METFSQDDPVTGFDVHEADDAFESLLVRDQVNVVQLLVGSQTVGLERNAKVGNKIEISNRNWLRVDPHSF